jgi:hypothetical protein
LAAGTHFISGLSEAFDQGERLVIEPSPILGNCNPTRGPMKQAHAQPLFQTADRATNPGCREAYNFRRADEASCFNDGGENADAADEPTIEPHHSCLPRVLVGPTIGPGIVESLLNI